jgi:RAB protein geranylgeranyltransferase component A
MPLESATPAGAREPSDVKEIVEQSDTMPLVSGEGKAPQPWSRMSVTAVFVFVIVAVVATVSALKAPAGLTSGDETAAVSLYVEEYDAVVLGTGLTESVISGILLKSGKKVLTMDRNNYYGGEAESMTPLSELYKLFGKRLEEEDRFGRGRDWNVDLVQKFLTADSEMTMLLIYTDVTSYVEFKQIEGIYEDGKVHKPSPYIYPLYGLGELPHCFARLSAVYGWAYMLDRPVEEILMEDGKVVGVKSLGDVFKTKLVIGDPSYFPNDVRKVGQVVRAICILNHPVAKMDNVPSFELTLPGSQTGRKSDIYVAVASNQNQVAGQGYYLGWVSTTVETSNPESELQEGLSLLQPIEQQFIFVKDIYHPKDDGKERQIFISKSYDATPNWETITDDIKDIYEKIFGEAFDFAAVRGDLSSE